MFEPGSGSGSSLENRSPEEREGECDTLLRRPDPSSHHAHEQNKKEEHETIQLRLRGGAGTASTTGSNNRLGDDERPSRLLWFLAGGQGRAPTVGQLRASKDKEKARKEKRVEKGQGMGFCESLGHDIEIYGGRKIRVRKGKKKTEKGTGDGDGGGGGVDADAGAGGGADGVKPDGARARGKEGEGSESSKSASTASNRRTH